MPPSSVERLKINVPFVGALVGSAVGVLIGSEVGELVGS